MQIRDVITAVRDKVNDPNRKYWTDVEVARWISHHNRQLFRARAQADRSYGWISHTFLKTETDRILTVKDDVFRYFFPTWVYKIYGVRELTQGTTKRGQLIDYREHPRDSNRGWYVSTDRSIDLMEFTAAVDLELECAHLPPEMHYGTIDSPSTARDEVRLASVPADQDTNAFPLSWEKDAYVGTEIELVTGSTETVNRRGLVSTVISHDQVYDNDLTVPAWVTRCIVFPKWPNPPQVGDTYELHVPLDESNFEYIAARVARSLYHRTRNLDGIAAVESVMAEGYDAYIAGLRPRQEQQPGFLVDPNSAPGHFNPDKDWSGEFLD